MSSFCFCQNVFKRCTLQKCQINFFTEKIYTAENSNGTQPPNLIFTISFLLLYISVSISLQPVSIMQQICRRQLIMNDLRKHIFFCYNASNNLLMERIKCLYGGKSDLSFTQTLYFASAADVFGKHCCKRRNPF